MQPDTERSDRASIRSNATVRLSIREGAAHNEPVRGLQTYTAPEAARILRLSSQRVRQLLASGDLRGARDEAGHWEVDARSVHELLKERREALSGGLEDSQRLSELEAEVRELRYLLGRVEARLEFTEKAEGVLRAERDRLLENLERERERAGRLEGVQEEARRLRDELEAERSKGFIRRLRGR